MGRDLKSYQKRPTGRMNKNWERLTFLPVCWLGLVLWQMDHCRLFNAKSIFIHIKSFISKIQFSIRTMFSSFSPIDRNLSGAITPDQSGPRSDSNKGVFWCSQSSSITGDSISDCLVSYPGHSFVGRSYPSAEKQSVYSTAAADWATTKFDAPLNKVIIPNPTLL